MKCPICGNEMEKGGVSFDSNMDLIPRWAPKEEIKIKGFKSWHREHQIWLQEPDEYRCIPREAKFLNAYYCHTCEKAVVILDKRRIITLETTANLSHNSNIISTPFAVVFLCLKFHRKLPVQTAAQAKGD